MKAIDKILNAIRRAKGLPVASRVGIEQAIVNGVNEISRETIDATIMSAMLALAENEGFGKIRLERFVKATQEIFDDAYRRYELDAIFALKRLLAEHDIAFAEDRGNGNGEEGGGAQK